MDELKKRQKVCYFRVQRQKILEGFIINIEEEMWLKIYLNSVVKSIWHWVKAMA